MSDYRWLRADEVMVFHETCIEQTGGAAGVRDANLLESALARPQNLAVYDDVNVYDIAASYAEGIARNHPFVDGNKRTALAAALYFLDMQGIAVAPERDNELTEKVEGLAQGRVSRDALARHLQATAHKKRTLALRITEPRLVGPAEGRQNGNSRRTGRGVAMPENTKEAAKRRAIFARTERLKRERGETARKDADARKIEQRKVDTAKREATQKLEQQRKDRTAEASRRVADANRKAESRRRQHAKDQTQKAFNRQVEDIRAAAVRDEAQKREASRKATADIEERHKRQRAEQQAEHRRQTAEVRLRHQAETRSLRSNETVALERHHERVRILDRQEGKALDRLAAERNSLFGRFKGQKHFDERREAVKERFESERMNEHRKLEALKESQFKVAQAKRLEQARERKQTFDDHRKDRQGLQQQQQAARPKMVQERAQAMTKAAEVQREPKREQSREMAR